MVQEFLPDIIPKVLLWIEVWGIFWKEYHLQTLMVLKKLFYLPAAVHRMVVRKEKNLPRNAGEHRFEESNECRRIEGLFSEHVRLSIIRGNASKKIRSFVRTCCLYARLLFPRPDVAFMRMERACHVPQPLGSGEHL